MIALIFRSFIPSAITGTLLCERKSSDLPAKLHHGSCSLVPEQVKKDKIFTAHHLESKLLLTGQLLT